MVKDKEDWKKSFNKAMCAIKLPHIEPQSGIGKPYSIEDAHDSFMKKAIATEIEFAKQRRIKK